MNFRLLNFARRAKKKNNTDDIIPLAAEKSEQVQSSQQKKPVATGGPAKKPVNKITKTSPSIQDAIDKIDKLESGKALPEVKVIEEKSKEEIKNDKITTSDSTLTRELLAKYWEGFVEQIKDKSPRMLATINNCNPELNNENSIVVSFQNQSQIDHFKESAKPQLIRYLKEKHGEEPYNVIERIVKMEIDESNTKFLTEKEKLDFLSDKNPAFKKLRQEFDLDFD